MVIQIVVTICIVFLVLPNIYNSYKKNSLTRLGAAIWFLFWILGIVIIWDENMIGLVGNTLGVERSIDALVYISIIFLFYNTLRQKIRINELSKEITMLNRKIALKKVKKKKE